MKENKAYKEGGALDIIGNTDSLYKFVRQDLGVPMNRGTPDEMQLFQGFETICESIKDWRIVPALMETFRDVKE